MKWMMMQMRMSWWRRWSTLVDSNRILDVEVVDSLKYLRNFRNLMICLWFAFDSVK